MHSNKITLKKIYSQYQNPGKFDSRELTTACECQLLAYRMGLGKVTVQMGFNGFDPIVTTEGGVQYFYDYGRLYLVDNEDDDYDGYDDYVQEF